MRFFHERSVPLNTLPVFVEILIRSSYLIGRILTNSHSSIGEACIKITHKKRNLKRKE
jgi:hypothetical protein